MRTTLNKSMGLLAGARIILLIVLVAIITVVAVVVSNKNKNKASDGSRKQASKTKKHNGENFYNDTARYCTGCHAQLPPNLEKSCDNNQCDTQAEEECECCKQNKPLDKMEREDLHLYGYLISLLTAMGVNDSLHPNATN